MGMTLDKGCSESKDERSFIEQCLDGVVDLGDIDQFVQDWHNGHGSEMTLAQFLGLSDTEYAMWVEQPSVFKQLQSVKLSQER